MTAPNLTLFTLGSAFGLRNVSPFCLKVEMLLTDLGLEFATVEQPDPRKAPKGKLPYLHADGRVIADSELIVEYLNELTQGRVYQGLSPAELSHGWALSRLTEEHLYWIFVASRWLDDAWWPHVVKGFFHIAPAIVRPLVASQARRQMRQTYHLQGLGRHSLEDQRGFARRDLQALQDSLTSERPFLFGDQPCVFDFTVAGFMAGVYDNKPATWVTDLAQEYNALKDYTERVQAHVGVYGRPV